MTTTAANLVTMTPSQTARAIETAVKMREPICLWGTPGVGKSDLVKQAAARLSYTVIDRRGSTMDPTDVNGLPMLVDGRTVWSRPDWLPRDPAALVLLFFDELNRAPVAVQNALLQLILDRCIGDYMLPENVVVMAACNPTGAGVQPMVEALANRFASHLHVAPDMHDWCEWALDNGVDPMVPAFLRGYGADLLNVIPEQRGVMSFPTPRSWTKVSKIMQAQPDRDVELAMVSGAVGHAAAVEFLAFVQLYRNLPNLDHILMDPANAPVPDRSDAQTLYAISAALSRRADEDNLGRVMTYLDRLPSEFNWFCVKAAAGRDNALTYTPEYTRWVVRHDKDAA